MSLPHYLLGLPLSLSHLSFPPRSPFPSPNFFSNSQNTQANRREICARMAESTPRMNHRFFVRLIFTGKAMPFYGLIF